MGSERPRDDAALVLAENGDDAAAIVVASDLDNAPAPLVLPGEGVRANPVRVYLESLGSENSQRTMRDCLKRVARVVGKDDATYENIPWWALRPEHTTTIRARLIRAYGASTARLTLAALKGVLRQCFVLGYVDGDRFHRVTAWKAVLGGDEAPAGRMLKDEEIARVRAACARRGAFEAALDEALFAAAITAGLRREELARLPIGALSDDARQLNVVGKRGKVRHMPLPPWAGGALEAWLAQRDRFPFTCEAMFVHVLGGKVKNHGMSKWQVWDRLRQLGELAQVPFTPHDLRRTYLSTLLDHADIATVQKLAGHADPRTTARYDRRPQQTRAKAVQVLEKWGSEEEKKKDG